MIAAVLTLFAVNLGRRPADFDHPYGHRRAENLGALGEAAILLAAGVLVSVEAITRLTGNGASPTVHWYELAVIGAALLLEAGRIDVTLATAQRDDSPALRSNVAHFAADMAGSLAVLVGLVSTHVRLKVHSRL